MSSSRTAFTPLTVGQIVEKCVAPPMPFRVTAFDGSTAGPEDAPLHLDITSPDALAYAVTAPGDLGLARAYTTCSISTASSTGPRRPTRLRSRAV